MRFLKKIQIQSNVVDDVWEGLRHVLPQVRDDIRRLVKQIEQDPSIKAKMIEDYGTGFVDDLGYVARLYESLRK